MIKEVCLHKEWIENRSNYFKKGTKKADPQLIEKVIYALYLLENLSRQNIKFIFKGGTCLLLLLKKVHRFSIDIDIITEMSKEDIEVKLNNIIDNNSIFNRFEEDKRYSSNTIPKSHYKLFYKSELYEDTGREECILLDILYEESSYSKLVPTNIDCEFIEIEGENIDVLTPDIDCILADKLTAFAPNTTGIEYDKRKELEIIKQLFDISNLFDECEDITTIKETFIKIATNEIEYRKIESTYIDVLDDIYETSLILSAKGSLNRDIFKNLEDGVKRIKSYIFSRNFIIEDAVVCASKAAYLSTLLKYDKEIERFSDNMDMNEINIKVPPYSKSFKSIKKISPEAYYYLHKAMEIRQCFVDEVATE